MNLETQVWMYVGIFFAALSAVFLFLMLYNRRERRRYHAIEAAVELGQWGLSDLSVGLTAYGVGDYSGFTRALIHFVRDVKTKGLPSMLTGLFEKLLVHYVKDELWRKKISDALTMAGGSAGLAAVKDTLVPK